MADGEGEQATPDEAGNGIMVPGLTENDLVIAFRFVDGKAEEIRSPLVSGPQPSRVHYAAVALAATVRADMLERAMVQQEQRAELQRRATGVVGATAFPPGLVRSS